MTKATRARYPLDFKQGAVGGWRAAKASRLPGLGAVDQVLVYLVRAHRQGKLKGADASR